LSATLKAVRISGNDVSQCNEGAAQLPFSTGAIFVPFVDTDLWVHGNRLLGNQGTGMLLGAFISGIQGSLRMRVQDNSQDGDESHIMIVAAANTLQFTGNQCQKSQGGNIAVYLFGRLVVADGNTVTGGSVGLHLQAFSSTGTIAIATSNIVSGG